MNDNTSPKPAKPEYVLEQKETKKDHKEPTEKNLNIPQNQPKDPNEPTKNKKELEEPRKELEEPLNKQIKDKQTKTKNQRKKPLVPILLRWI